MSKIFRLFIDGEWKDSVSGDTFVSDNPAKPNEILGKFQKGKEQDVKAAVDSALRALPDWSGTPAPQRGRILLRTAQLLRESKEQFAREMTMEMGKILLESRGDVQEAIDITEYMAGEGRRMFGHTTTSESQGKFCMTVRLPVGVCGLITPWNFPMAIPAWKIMTALICGNTAVFKPSSDTPLIATRLVQTLDKAGLPKGVLNMVTGSGDEAGMPIVRHPDVRCISFTGHRDTGAGILEEAGLKRVGLEMGGKNPIIIMDDADLDLAVDGSVWGGYATSGQRCTAASRIIVHDAVKKTFETKLAERVRLLRTGDGLEPTTDVGPLVNKAAQEKTAQYVEIGTNEGARLLVGGSIPKEEGFFYEPTLFTDCTKDMRVAQEEIFGPVVCLLSAKNLDEAVQIANSVDYGLSSAIYTRDLSVAMKAVEELETGVMYVNAPTIGAEVHLPFGGMKRSGIGTREAGIDGINEFTELKSVYIDYSGRLQRAQIDMESPIQNNKRPP